MHTYLGQRRPLPALKQQTHQGRADRAPGQRPDGQLPPILLFPRARKHAHHDEDDIGRCGQVEELQHKVPPAEPWRHPEKIEIAGGEDEAVEQLGQETDTLGRLVAVNGPDEDAFGGRVRDIAEDAEDVHVEDRSHGGGGEEEGISVNGALLKVGLVVVVVVVRYVCSSSSSSSSGSIRRRRRRMTTDGEITVVGGLSALP